MNRFILYYTTEKVSSEAFIRRAASDYTERDITGAEILREPNGKPYFSDPSLPFFSLSHSGGYTVCAVGSSPCGVDIQEPLFRGKRRDPDELLRIAKRFFHPDEHKKLIDISPDEITGRFFDIWTAKESYVKYTGAGLTAFQSFSVFLPETHGFSVIKKVPFPLNLFLTSNSDFAVILKKL